MDNVIVLARRRSWLALKRFIASGQLLQPQPPLPRERPQSDAAAALAYAFEQIGSPK